MSTVTFSEEYVDGLIKDGEEAIAERDAKIAALEAQLDHLAAENLGQREREQKIIQIINNADNNYCMCGEAMETHGHGGCGHPTGMFNYHYEKWLESSPETPTTDAWQREQMAKGVEMCAAAIQKQAWDCDEGEGIAAALDAMEIYSGQLRNGEAV